MFNNDNNIIEVPLYDEEENQITALEDFTQAKYAIYPASSNVPLFEATLGNGIEVEDGMFIITTPKLDFQGMTYQEMKVKDVVGNVSTILQTKQQFAQTRIKL